MYTRAVAAFRGSGSIHPVCPTHQKFARLCAVKDTMKDIIMEDPSSFVLSERIPASSGNGEMYLKVRDRYVNMECCAVNEKSRKMVRIKTVCFTAVRRKTLVVSSNGNNKNLV
jgi:hypothetical protein